MKKNLLLLIILCNVLYITAQKTVTEEISHKIYGKAIVEKKIDANNKLVQKLTYTKDTIYTAGNAEIGKCVFYYETGKVQAKGNYVIPKKVDFFGRRDRKKTGKWLFYNEKNNLSGVLNYENDREDGQYINYHENGKISGSGTYSKGRITGDAKRFFNNGQLHRVLVYKDGEIFNVKEFYNKNGSTLDYGTLKDGEGTLKHYDIKTGEFIKTYTFEEGSPKDIETKITKTAKGQIKELFSRDSEGDTIKIARYLNAKLHGIQEEYDHKGNLDTSTEYKNGVKNGKYENFNTDGTLFCMYTYLNGKKVGSFKRTPEGTKKKYYRLNEGFYDKKERLTGQFTSYLAEKKDVIASSSLEKDKAIIVTSGTYKKDTKIGLWKQFDEKGNLIEEINFAKRKKDPYSRKQYYNENDTKILKNSLFYDNKKNEGFLEKYYANGQLESRSILKDKKKSSRATTYLEDGAYLEYYMDGTLKVEGQNKADKKVGQWKWYNEKGLILRDYTYDENSCCFAISRKDYKYRAGKLSSLVIQSNHKQNPSNENEYYFGSTLSKEFNENGTLRELETKKKYKYGFYGVLEGQYQRYSSKGILEVEGHYKNDKKEGVWKYFNYDGDLSDKKTYVSGKAIGPFKTYYYYPETKAINKNYIGTKYADRTEQTVTYFYENGTVEKTGDYVRIYKNGWKGRQGVWKSNHKNGKLKSVGNYVKGYKDGEWLYYHDNGKLLAKGSYLPINDETLKLKKRLRDEAKIGTWKYYFNDGTLKEETNFTVSKDFKYLIKNKKEYFENGKLKSETLFHGKEPRGNHREFFENGQLALDVSYEDEEDVITIKQYFSNGNLKCETTQVDLESNYDFFHTGENNDYAEYKGICKFYYENGSLKFEVDFDEGGIIKNVLKYYDAKGNILAVGTLKNGNGTVHYYDGNNKITKTESYTDGEFDY